VSVGPARQIRRRALREFPFRAAPKRDSMNLNPPRRRPVSRPPPRHLAGPGAGHPHRETASTAPPPGARPPGAPPRGAPSRLGRALAPATPRDPAPNRHELPHLHASSHPPGARPRTAPPRHRAPGRSEARPRHPDRAPPRPPRAHPAALRRAHAHARGTGPTSAPASKEPTSFAFTAACYSPRPARRCS